MVRTYAVAVLLLSLVPVLGSGAEKEGIQSPPYRDEDLQGYGESPDSASSAGDTSRSTDRQTPKKEKQKTEADKKYWCKQGTRYRANVEKAKNEVRDAESEFSEREYEYYRGKISSSQYAAAKKNLKKASNRLEKAEQDLSSIENEAHRNWIPPGWLRCQFE